MATPTRTPLVVLAGVEKTYHSGRVAFRALRGIDLEIEAGEMVAIVGPSGSGKTTIVNLIAGIDRPSAGTVTVNGTRLDLTGQEDLAIWRRANIGMVFQFFQLMPTLSALDNTMLPMELAKQGSRRTREEQARTLLSAVGLTNRVRRLPAELSGGEQQRVALARAMARRPRILIGDEPTGNLDSETAREMFRLVDDLNAAGTTVIFVTHDQGLAALAPRVVTVRDGRIVSDTSRVAGGTESRTHERHVPQGKGRPAAPSRQEPACRGHPRPRDRQLRHRRGTGPPQRRHAEPSAASPPLRRGSGDS